MADVTLPKSPVILDKGSSLEIESSHCNFIQSIPKRYYITGLLFVFSLMEGYVLTNMNVVIVDITSEKKIVRNNETEIIKAEYDWTSMEKSLVLGMNSGGQMFAALAGGVVHRIGGVTFLGVGKVGEAIICLTTPFVMNFHVNFLIGYRFILGIFEGLSFVGFTDIFAHWAPPNERVRLMTLATLGLTLGAATNFPISGFVIQHFGWKTLFYSCGAVILFESIIWIIFVSNDPSTDKFITEKERKYLTKEINHISKEEVAVPFKSVFTSLPVYVLVNSFFISGLTLSFSNLVPLYIKDILDTDIQTIGILSGIPGCSAFIVQPLLAYFLDYLRSKPDGYGIDKIHKVTLFWSQFLGVVFYCLTTLCYNITGCVILLTFAKICVCISLISLGTLPIDLSGQFAGLVQSITQLARCTTLFLNPILIGLLVPNHTQWEWITYFLVIAFLTLYGAIVFVIFGSGDLQPWAKVSARSNTENTDKENKEKI